MILRCNAYHFQSMFFSKANLFAFYSICDRSIVWRTCPSEGRVAGRGDARAVRHLFIAVPLLCEGGS
ncbi:hypothetical protein GOP47_0020861 [Adiantum capillus-veneris]|uniref:Uncharacterized protein n=1 Tax=Adiantum capillus-veneris TaxID=13818 RepID=A0A9D4U9Z3_ADICA|nr:hypothetical protein GOP47_0020861 [Adiantum capillus-veneris]